MNKNVIRSKREQSLYYCPNGQVGDVTMHRPYQLRVSVRLLLAALALFQFVACGGPGGNSSTTPTPASPTATPVNADVACPTMIPDQPTNLCPRLKNITLSCGGNGMLHTSFTGGSGEPFILGAKLDDGSVFSAVLVVINCQDGPREAITFGVTYTGQVRVPETGPVCISQSKAVYSQFQFGNPGYAGLEGLAKGKMHETLDERSLTAFAARLGLVASTPARCSPWREMP